MFRSAKERVWPFVSRPDRISREPAHRRGKVVTREPKGIRLDLLEVYAERCSGSLSADR